MFTVKDLEQIFLKLFGFYPRKEYKKIDLLKYIYEEITKSKFTTKSIGYTKDHLMYIAHFLNLTVDDRATAELERDILSSLMASRRSRSSSASLMIMSKRKSKRKHSRKTSKRKHKKHKKHKKHHRI
jgi:hypothetical protein